MSLSMQDTVRSIAPTTSRVHAVASILHNGRRSTNCVYFTLRAGTCCRGIKNGGS
eukprot:jgi/Botrbrau1/12515/Bobra.0169s0057.1